MLKRKYIMSKPHTFWHLLSLRGDAENNVLSLIPVEPAHRTIVHLKVKLTALMTDANGIKDRSAAFDVLQIDKSSNCDALSGFGLEGVPVEKNVPAVNISGISTLALGKVDHNSTVLKDAVIGITRGVLNHITLGSVELKMSHEALFHQKQVNDY